MIVLPCSSKPWPEPSETTSQIKPFLLYVSGPGYFSQQRKNRPTQYFDSQIADSTVVEKKYALSKNHSLNLEFGSSFRQHFLLVGEQGQCLASFTVMGESN